MEFEIKNHDIIGDHTRPYASARHGVRVLRKLKLRYDRSLWEGAACAGLDTNVFFPSEHEIVSLGVYRRLCAECPVFDTCMEWAVVHERYGIWAGTSEKERAAIRRHAGIAVNELNYDGVLYS